MEKLTFNIPQNTKISNKNTNNTSTNNTNTNNTSTNNTNYTQITTNVYKFNNVTTKIDDIYILFNTACNYKKKKSFQHSLLLFEECKNKITNKVDNDIAYNIYINLALINTELNNSTNIIFKYYEKAIEIYNDRPEPYYYLALYCNRVGLYDKSFELLNKASTFSYDKVVLKYPTTQFTSYGKYLYDALSVACFWLQKYEKSKELLEQIINDDELNADKNRLTQNLKLTNEQIDKLNNNEINI